MIESSGYRTPARRVSWLLRTFPTFHFYRKFMWNVYRSSALARSGTYDDQAWVRSSWQVIRDLESVGVACEVSGVEHVQQLTTPCVFVGNHMSTLETMVLPAIIHPIRDVTFVVKKSLLEYPLFKHIVGARDPIAVGRENPREDLKAVIEGGIDRLNRGISIVVFPQTTRASVFDGSKMNTIGIKLAARAGVPVVPVALKTDAWGNGRRIKDLGRIDPSKTVYFEFGAPLTIQGRGAKQHQEVIQFIQAKLKAWGGEVATKASGS